MPTVFIAGSIAISRLHPSVVDRIASVVAKDMAVVVGDADGADTSIQRALLAAGATDITVYCSGDTARNNIGGWPVAVVETDARPGSRAFFTAKDVAMADAAEYGLMVWDAKSTGTLRNILELLARHRTSIVFVNRDRVFVTVNDSTSLRGLVAAMSMHARAKAEEKLGLSARLEALDREQFSLAI